MLYDILVYYIKNRAITYITCSKPVIYLILEITYYILHAIIYIYIILYIVCSVDYMLHITD